ncbi:MAG TPA: hydrogenase maturation nickel metallochaperone HypA [Gemmataceae bacterium]|nr:hydrogenase maturation nickel metallochaperone HypA [Gemmataceae bacterium]
MHELSIALGILDIAEEEAGERAARVAAVHLKLGPLSGIVKEALLSAFEMAREGTVLAQAELVIEEIPLVIHCPACAADRTPASLFELRCPACGALSADVVRGRELEISALEIES